MSYQVGASTTVRALHRMPVEGPEGELHEHEYRIEVVVERVELDEHGMVVDLDALDGQLRSIRGELTGRDLEAIRPREAEAVTVEVFARWVHGRLRAVVSSAGGGELSVRVFETADAFGGFRGPVSSGS